MRKTITFLILMPALVFSSCKILSSLYPLSENENDFLFKKDLIGKWRDAKDSSGFYKIDTVAGTNGKLYLVSIVAPDKNKVIDTSRFLARLISIKAIYFLDCRVDIHNSLSKPDTENEWVIARHFFCRISLLKPDTIEMALPDTDELLKLIRQKKIKLNYTLLKKDDCLLLDNPEVLKKSIASLEQFPSLYKDKNMLHRLK